MPNVVGQGGTITLRAEYRDGANNLVDPTNPLLAILNPSAVVVASNLVPTRESLGLYRYAYTVATDAPLGDWTARWTGTINGVPVTGDEEFEVVPAGSVGGLTSSPALITLEEYKTLVGMDPTDNRSDARILALLPAASRSVRSFTDRKFELADSPSPRTFQYDGSGFLDIDDCTNVTLVQTDAGYAGQTYDLDASEWTAMPDRETPDDDPHYYIILHSTRSGASPEMGFKRNLDTLEVTPKQPLITVTATWGWSFIPEDVKLATAWIVEDTIRSPESGLASEAIEGFSRSWARGRMLAVPNRARDLLANYARAFG